MGPKHEDQLVGKTFEKCRILAKLGTGGMGSVWLAEHFGLGRKVAVKILPPEMGRDPEYVARFMREATTAGRMEHPNIVQIHDVGYAEGRHFIVMQYVDGESLSTVVENLGAMEPRDAARIASGMLRGLQHAHEEGVVHRDVKPDNVLITKGDEPKLLDFGLAIETETALQITKDGMVVGTPYYLAPEQARGQKATPLCDVYAAGVTLYYLLTGKRPFVGATALAVLNKHIHEPPVPPMKHKPGIPKPLNDIILKMMAKKPADRYQSAAAAANDLDAFLKGKQIDVRVPVQLPLGLDRLTKKQQIIAAASGGSGLLVLIVLLIVAFSGGKPAPSEPPPEAPKPRSAAEAPESVKLSACLKFDTDNRGKYEMYPEILTTYENYINSTASEIYVKKAQEAKKAFYDFAEKQAVQELEKILKESDPYKRVQLLAQYPRTLRDLTTIDKRHHEESARASAEAERKELADEKRLDLLIQEGKFKEAGPLLELLLGVAQGTSLERLKGLKTDFSRMEREYDDALLRRLSENFGLVHTSFSDSLSKRDTIPAYVRVTKFLKDITDPAERQRTRVPGVNYETLINASGESGFKDTSVAQVRTSLASAFVNAQDTLSYRALSDLQDALDIEYLITAAVRGLDVLSRSPAEIRFVTLNQVGRMTINQNGLVFQPKGGIEKKIEARKLLPADLVMLAAAGEGLTVEKLFDTNDLLARSIGAAYLYSSVPERYAQAIRWFRQAEQLGLQGLSFRLAGFRENGYQEVRERIAASKAMLDKKNFDGAKQPLADVEAGWAHDPALRDQIGRAMASILVAEVLYHDRLREYAKVKQAARKLRADYKGLYREEDLFVPYAQALRLTGDWTPMGNVFNDDWTWEGKAKGSEAPVVDETGNRRGLRIKPEKSIELSSVKTRGATGVMVELSVGSPFSGFATGIRFDASSKDGKVRKLIVRDTGEVALLEGDGLDEKRVEFGSLAKKLGPGQWIELGFIAEGGDLVCFVAERPIFLVSATIPTDRDIGFWSSADANVRFVKIRK
jgi:serine/threonine protein kinase